MVIHTYGQLSWIVYIAIQDIFTKKFIHLEYLPWMFIYEYILWTDNAGKWAFIVIFMLIVDYCFDVSRDVIYQQLMANNGPLPLSTTCSVTEYCRPTLIPVDDLFVRNCYILDTGRMDIFRHLVGVKRENLTSLLVRVI